MSFVFSKKLIFMEKMLGDQILGVERNYNQMAEDFRRIRISTDKIIRRAANIDSVEIKNSEDSS